MQLQGLNKLDYTLSPELTSFSLAEHVPAAAHCAWGGAAVQIALDAAHCAGNPFV